MNALLDRLRAVEPCAEHRKARGCAYVPAPCPNALCGASHGCGTCFGRLVLRGGSDRRKSDRRTPSHCDWLVGSIKAVQERETSQRKADRRTK